MNLRIMGKIESQFIGSKEHKNKKSQDLKALYIYSMISIEGVAKWNVLLMGNPFVKELFGIV